MPDLLHTITIAAPIAAVWAEITKLGGKQRAMMDSVLECTFEPGAPLYYKSVDGRRVYMVGRVVEVDAPRLLVHTQQLTFRDDPPTLVTWELAETAGGTRVTLRHTGWPEDTPRLNRVDDTWASILAALKRLLETGDISVGLKLKYAVWRAMSGTMPAKTRTENVKVPD